MTKQSINSENEGELIYASGHYFQIVNGIRKWLTNPPNDYICTDGSKFEVDCPLSDTTQEEWFSMRTPVSLGE